MIAHDEQAHDWVLRATDKRGREYVYYCRDVGIVDALDFQRGLSDDPLGAAVKILSRYVVSGDWQGLTPLDAIRLAGSVVSGEADEGKSQGSASGPV